MKKKNILNSIINSAKSICRRDGYDQIIYVSESDILDGTCSFTRLYPKLNLFDVKPENVKGIVKGTWINGFYWVKYYSVKTDKEKVMNYIKSNEVQLMK